jgi:hypothetical protein
LQLKAALVHFLKEKKEILKKNSILLYKKAEYLLKEMFIFHENKTDKR